MFQICGALVMNSLPSSKLRHDDSTSSVLHSTVEKRPIELSLVVSFFRDQGRRSCVWRTQFPTYPLVRCCYCCRVQVRREDETEDTFGCCGFHANKTRNTICPFFQRLAFVLTCHRNKYHTNRLPSVQDEFYNYWNNHSFKMSAMPIARGRLMEERKAWRRDHPYGFYARPIAKGDGSSDIMKWEAGIPGKPGTDWEGGVYKVSMEFPWVNTCDKCSFAFWKKIGWIGMPNDGLLARPLFCQRNHCVLVVSTCSTCPTRCCAIIKMYTETIILPSLPNANLFHPCFIPTCIHLVPFAYPFWMKKKVGARPLPSSKYWWAFKICWMIQIRIVQHKVKPTVCLHLTEVSTRDESKPKRGRIVPPRKKTAAMGRIRILTKEHILLMIDGSWCWVWVFDVFIKDCLGWDCQKRWNLYFTKANIHNATHNLFSPPFEVFSEARQRFMVLVSSNY